MKIELTQEQLKLKDEFREFVDHEIKPYAQKYDKEEILPEEIIEKLADKGYLAAMVSKEFNGREMDMVSLGLLNEEVGRGCSSVRSLLTVHGMVALAIMRWGSMEQKNKWLADMVAGRIISAFALTEPNVGSDAKNIEMLGKPDGDFYVLKGTKKWITFGEIADLFLVFARCGESSTAFLVERNTPGLTIKPIKGLLGIKATMTAELNFDGCRIPKENIVARVGAGLSHVALASLDYGRYTIACGCVGIGQACLEACLRYTRKRKQFGTVLRKHQLIQKMITEMVVNIRASRLLCYSAGYMKDIMDPDSIMETWNAKYFASTMLNKVVSDAVQIHGANGCSSDYPIERFYRDAKVMEIIEGTTQMHEILIATNAYRGIDLT